MAQEQTKRSGGNDDDNDAGSDSGAGQERREKLADDTDDLLDEIDDVLEENAEDFVRAYVQKGGQRQIGSSHLARTSRRSPTTCVITRQTCCPSTGFPRG